MAVSHHVDQEGYTRRERRQRSTMTIGPGMILGIVGAVGIVVSLFLSWRIGSVHPSEIPASFLWDRNATSEPSFLIYLIPLAVLLAVGSFIPGGAALRLVAGVGTLVVVGLFAYQLHRVTDAIGADFVDALDPGFYVAAIGGVLGFVSGFLPTTFAARRAAVH
jgi:hypothetical protein